MKRFTLFTHPIELIHNQQKERLPNGNLSFILFNITCNQGEFSLLTDRMGNICKQLSNDLCNHYKIQFPIPNVTKLYSITRTSVLRLAACSSAVHGTPSAHLFVSSVSP